MAAEGSSGQREEAGVSKVVESSGKDESVSGDLKKAEEGAAALPNSSSRDAQLPPVVAVKIGGGATLASDVFQQGLPQMAAVDGFRSPWGYYPPSVNSSGDGSSANALRPDPSNLAPPPFPFFYPAAIPGFLQVPLQDQNQSQGGVYVVPVLPYFGPLAGYPPGGLIPLSLNAPLGPSTSPETGGTATGTAGPGGGPAEAGGSGLANREVAGQEGLRQRHAAPRLGQGPRPEVPRQVVRRFRVGFQLDLFLILKLTVVVMVFNHDGSKGRLMLLFLLAVIVYLYQTGALAPFLRWISQSAQRAMMPPQQPGPVQAEAQAGPGLPADEGEGGAVANAVVNPPVAASNTDPAPGQHPPAPPHPDGEAGGQAEDERPAHGPNWWGFLKEVQMIVVGFVTSLLPGYQHVE